MTVHHRLHPAALAGLLLVAATMLPQVARAQLYSWKDAEGNVTIKNSPPAWYKQDESSRGPRVQVLRRGKVIDDTSWSMERRQEGRVQAAPLEAPRPAPAQVPVVPRGVYGQLPFAPVAPIAPTTPQAAEAQPPVPPAAPRAPQTIQADPKQD